MQEPNYQMLEIVNTYAGALQEIVNTYAGVLQEIVNTYAGALQEIVNARYLCRCLSNFTKFLTARLLIAVLKV